jgi:hypothetical protein
VNVLNVGLHSYGFTQGLEEKLILAYGIISLVVLLGAVIKLLETLAHKQAGPTESSGVTVAKDNAAAAA